MVGACCISSVNPPLGICLPVEEDICNNFFQGIYLGDGTVCPASGSCIVSPEGKINDCEWCCGCNSEGEPKRQYYPCCFRTTDGICDCPQAHSFDYIETCSGRAKGDCDLEGFTKLRSDMLVEPEQETIEDCYTDVRIPRACCHMTYNELNVPTGITCSNVCNSRECDLKNQVSPATYPSVYSNGAVCGKSALTKYTSAYNCGAQIEGIVGASQRRYTSHVMRQERVGTCFTLYKRENNEYYYNCEPGFKDSCKSDNSIFVPMKDSQFEFCFSPYAPKRPQFSSTGTLIPQSMSSKDFRELNLNFGDFYQGGYFIGIFSPRNADIYGSELTALNNKQKITTSNVEGVGSSKSLKNTKWALFMDDASVHSNVFTKNETYKPLPRLSRYDGFYNTHGTEYEFAGLDCVLTKQFKRFPYHGQLDWYIPSVNEIKFLFNKLVMNSSNYFIFLNNFYNIGNFNPIFYTSSGINSDYFYAGIMDFTNSELFGKIIPIHKNSRHYIKKFRRIELLD